VFLVGSGSVCTVADVSACDRLSSNLAASFMCFSETECLARLETQLDELEPFDAHDADKQRYEFFESARKKYCNNNGQCSASSVFTPWNSWARVPFSSTRVNVLLEASKKKMNQLDLGCGAAWAINNCDQDGCLSRNQSCVEEMTTEESVFVARSTQLFYSIRREESHLRRILAYCQSQSAQTCISVLTTRLTESNTQIALLTPTVNGTLQSFGAFSLFYGSELSRHLAMRDCNDVTIPCLKVLVDPALAASNVTVSQTLNSSNEWLMRPVLNQNLWSQVLANASKSMDKCGFVLLDGYCHLNFFFFFFVVLTVTQIDTRNDYAGLCDSDIVKLSAFTYGYRAEAYQFFLLPEQYQVLRSMLSSCWLDCEFIRRANELVTEADKGRLAAGILLTRLILLLCETDWCVSSAINVLSSKFPDNVVLQSFREVVVPPSLLYSALGMIEESLCLLTCCVVAFVLIFRWKVFLSATMYIVIVVFVVIGSVFNLLYWIRSSQLIFQSARAANIFLLLTNVVQFNLFCILLFLAINWLFALFEIFEAKPLTVRAERSIKWSVIVFVVLLFSIMASTGMAREFRDYISAEAGVVISTAFVVSATILRVLNLVLTVWIMTCTIIGMVLLRKRNASKVAMGALARILVVDVILIVSVAFQLSLFIMSNKMFNSYWHVPEWYRYLLVGVIVQAIQSAAILFVVVVASSAKRPSPDIGVEMSQELLLPESNDQSRKVPRAYEI
jgi:hypothetical protein